WRWRRGLRRLGVVAFLDPALLAIADQPAQELRFVDADEDVVDRFIDRGIVDQLAGRALAAIQFGYSVVELVQQAGKFSERLIAVRLVVHQARHEALSALVRRADRCEIR